MPKQKQKNQAAPKVDPELDQQAALLDNRAEQEMRTLRHKHPDCIPVYFSKHKAAPKTLKDPTLPFMLFKKDLKIQQAMYRLYQQIQTKGLYFFCLEVNKEKAKYVKINPGPTIQQIFNKYGRNQCLVLIYGNSEMGLEGLHKMEKCMITFLIIAGLVWIFLFGYRYFASSDGPAATSGQGTGSSMEGWVEQAN